MLESAVVVVAVAAIAVGLVWVRRSGGRLMRPEERVAHLDVVARAPTDMPTFTPEPTATSTSPSPGRDGGDAGGEPTPSSVTHVVAAGESLFAIAALYDVAPEEIAAVNGLDRPEALGVGQELAIPVSEPGAAQDPADDPGDPAVAAADRDEAAEAASSADGADTPPEATVVQGDGSPAGDPVVLGDTGADGLAAAEVVVAEAEVYVVKGGDTLGGIAARYGLPLDALLELNGDWLTSVDQMLQVGDRVTVKAAEVVTATPDAVTVGPVAGAAPAVAVGPAPGGPAAVPYEAARGARFETPGVLSPGEGSVVTGNTVLLRWVSAGLLPRGVSYVVSLRPADAPEESATFVWVPANATALRVPSDFRPALGSSKHIAWTVSVRRRGGRVVDREGTLLSPAPSWSTFTWSPGG